MREIKFRAWDTYLVFKHNKLHKMVYFELDDLDGSYIDLYGTHLGKDTILMLWTGLTDKNGTEICEGDMVRNTFKPHTNYTSGSEVFFDYDGAWVMMGDSRIKLTELGELEVIGNVYENL